MSSGTGTAIGIDLGTSSVKVLALALDDRHGSIGSTTVEAEATEAYPVDRPAPGRAETNPEAWWSAIDRALRLVLGSLDPSRVVGIGLSGQMHGVVLADDERRPVGPAVLWQDARAVAEAARLSDLPDPLRARLANPVSPGMAGPILAWLTRHQPDLVAAASWALQPKDWVRARLTGRVAAEPSDASATLLYDVATDRWSAEAIEALGLDADLLAPLLDHGGVRAGGLEPELARAWGLAAGLPVAAGSGDTAAAALGSGLVDRGRPQLTLGTGIQVATVIGRPDPAVVGPDPVVHHYRSALPGGWYALAAGLNGGSALDWARRLLGADWDGLYRTAERPLAADAPIFLPHLLGERTPYLNPDLRGAWIGLAARHQRQDLLGSALEGVAFACLDAVEALEAAVGPSPQGRELRVAGGGTVDATWRTRLAEILADDRGPARLVPVDTPSASGRGAALLGLRAAGLVDDASLRALADDAGLRGLADDTALRARAGGPSSLPKAPGPVGEPEVEVVPADPEILAVRRDRWRQAVQDLGPRSRT